MWSDPDDIDTWSVSPRGAGWLFGSTVTNEVSHFSLFVDPVSAEYTSDDICVVTRLVQPSEFTDTDSTSSSIGARRLQIYVCAGE